MNSNLIYAKSETPVPSEKWRLKSDSERISLVILSLEQLTPESKSLIDITSAKPDGQIVVRFREQLPANIRGTFLLDIECLLKENIDSGITIWLETMGDRSSLRKLRGIEIKS
jgi:hypothetical protein